MLMHCYCFPRTTDTDEHFVPYRLHQTKTETLYYTGTGIKMVLIPVGIKWY